MRCKLPNRRKILQGRVFGYNLGKLLTKKIMSEQETIEELIWPRSEECNWQPKGRMDHYILLNAVPWSTDTYYRIRADRIDWITQRIDEKNRVYTVVCTGGRELGVMEPTEIILRFIEDPCATCLTEVEYKSVNHFELDKKYGSEKAHVIYKKIMRLP